MPKKAAPLQLRTRITGMQFLQGKDLQDHTGNFRTHPQHQRDALAGVLREWALPARYWCTRASVRAG